MSGSGIPSDKENTGRPWRLSALMVSFIALTVAITTLLQLGLVDHYAIDHASEEARLRMEQLSWQMRDSLDRTMDQAAHDVFTLRELPGLRHATSPDVVRRIFDDLKQSDPNYAWIGMARPDGKVFAATGGLLENRDISSRPWFHTGQHRLTIEDYHPAVLLEKLLPNAPDPWRFIDASGPIRDEDGNLLGVLAIHFSWEWARTIARELLIPAFREFGAQIIVVRRDGMVMLGPEPMIEQHITTQSLKLALAGKTGAIVERWPDGRDYVTGFSLTGRNRPQSRPQWAVLVRQTEDKAMASAHASERRVLSLGVVVAGLLAAVAAWLARRIVRPLQTLSGAIERIAQAPGSGTSSSIPDVHSFHEVHVLSDAMRHLLDSERRHRDALEHMNTQLEATVAKRTAELRELLMRDALTGLPNRRALMQMLPESMGRAAALGHPCAVMFLDMDGFKGVNDTYGHEVGDALLRQFAVRLLNGIRETDTAARLAGDEFVVVLDMVNDVQEAEHKAGTLLRHLSAPFDLDGIGVTVSASIGLAMHLPHQQQDATALLARADSAMYAAKRGGKRRVAVAAREDGATAS